MSNPSRNDILQPVAENYTTKILDEIDINIGPLAMIYRELFQELDDIVNGRKNFSSVYIQGLYGTGKTLLLRKFSHDVVNSDAYKRVIPVYYYLGEKDFRPFITLSEYISDVTTYIEEGREKANIVGRRDAWKERIEVLKKCYSEVEPEIQKTKEIDVFYKCMQCLNREKYIPMLVFDEFERVIYTGEGLRSDTSKENIVEFLGRYLELTRGRIFSGIFILATTRPIEELIEKAFDEEKRHITEIGDKLHIPKIKEKYRKLFPMLLPNISYNVREEIKWNYLHLELLSKKYNLTIHTDILRVLSEVLPTPRAIVQISKRIALQLEKAESLSSKSFFKLIESEIDEFLRRLENEKIGEKWVILPRTQWHIRFRKLLEEGYFVVKREDYTNVAKVLGFGEGKSSHQKVNSLLRKLYELGLYVRGGPGTYMLNPYILAYALKINRLPTGEEASLDNLVLNIKGVIAKAREEARSKKKTRSSGTAQEPQH